MQTSSNLIRRGGLAAMLGGILGTLMSPFFSVAWFATRGGAESLENPLVAVWSEPFARIFSPLLNFAPPDVVYLTYGKIFLLEIIGFLVGLLALHTWQAPHAGGLEKWGFRLALVGTVLLIVGLIGAFWVGTLWVGAVGLSYFAFVLPAYLVMSVGWTLFGIGTLRAKVAPRLGAWLLIVGGLCFYVMTALLGQHNSLGWGLVALAWIVLGYALWSGKYAPVRRAASVTLK